MRLAEVVLATAIAAGLASVSTPAVLEALGWATEQLDRIGIAERRRQQQIQEVVDGG